MLKKEANQEFDAQNAPNVTSKTNLDMTSKISISKKLIPILSLIIVGGPALICKTTEQQESSFRIKLKYSFHLNKVDQPLLLPPKAKIKALKL
jgi:hypothetical protein